MVDMQGNRVGPRGTFTYITDAGESINYSQDRSVGLAVGNILSTTSRRPQSVNDRYLRGRYVLAQLVSDPSVTKRIVIGDPASNLMTEDSSTNVQINSQLFVITGRVGEQVSYLKLSQPEPPPE